MILRIAYIAFFIISGLILLKVQLGNWAYIVAGISAILIGISYLIGPAQSTTAPGARRWLW